MQTKHDPWTEKGDRLTLGYLSVVMSVGQLNNGK
jgi:hypothetical protein